MKRYVCLLFLLLVVAVPFARAQQSPDDQYVIIYSLMQQADTLAGSGQPREALQKYVEVQKELEQFQEMYPDWNTNIVGFRLKYLAGKIAAVTSQLPATNAVAETSSGSGTNSEESVADLKAQLNALRAQMQNLQAGNTTLQAKLKEALAVKPTAIDPRELARAQAQIESLTKENALLKASAAEEKNGTASGKESNTVAQAQAALASANQKLGEQTDRVNKLAAENKTLQARVQSLMTSPSATDALQQENEVLQKQLAGLQSSATNSATNNTELNSELADARAQITTLKYAAGVSKLENEALENRIRQLQTQTSSVAATPAPGQADNEEKIRALTQERDDLLAKLGDANKELYGRKKQGAAARIDALTDQVNTLRARIAVDEAQAVPYTPAELALFKQSAPQMAGPDSDQKSISELPSGSAELAAAAQNYFSAGQYEKAGEDYQKILQRDEHNGLALANLATIELQENKLADAEKHIKAALAESPDDSYNLATLGKIEFAQGKYDDALNALSRAAKLDPNNPEIENYLGVTLGHKGLRAQAETALRKAVQLDPNYGAAHNNLAVIYLSQNPPLVELARWHYQKALADGQPRNPALEKMLAAKGAPVDSQSADQQENNN